MSDTGGSTMTGGGETAESVSGWTTDTNRSVFIAILAEMDRRYEQRFSAQGEALQKAHDGIIKEQEALDRRYEQRFESQQEAVDKANAATEKAIDKAQDANEQRLRALQDQIASLFAEQDRRYEQRFIAQQEAIGKSDASTEKRFESVNEFRSQLADQTATFLPRGEAEAQRKEMITVIESVGRRSEDRYRALSDKVDTLAKRADQSTGRNSGHADSWQYLVAAIGALTAIAGIIVAIVLSSGGA